ncbi:MAG: zinc-dependent metalloprotease family protein, partial [Planctomycetota bacterium]
MGEALARAPMDAGPLTIRDGEVIHLPLPDGGTARFLVKESPIMEPELAAKYPQIRTYRGQGLDDPSATLRLDHTPSGLHAMILSASGSVFIDPYRRHDSVHHISYYKRDLVNPHGDALRCRFDESYRQDSPQFGAGFESAFAAEGLPSGSLLRTYRIAVAATGEYTRFHGNKVEHGLAAVVTAMNRINGIYERDVAIRMILVADNDQIIYTKQGTDPYNNHSGFQMLGQNQENLDTVIGNGNYDIGHVFSTGGGGVAYLGVTCNSGFKAGGVTGLPSPIGDPFYVDYVAHEMGHQWGADHSFNGNEGSCSGGNRSASTAYEPGSASTIMGYAGICGSQNLQSSSDPYF